MLKTDFINDIIVPYDVLDTYSAKILENECNSLKVSPEIFVLTCRGICKQSLMNLNLFRQGHIHLTKEEVQSYFNIDILKSEVAKLKEKNLSYEIPTLPEIGDTLDKYMIKSVLGKGATSVVYKAVNIFLKKEVAIKVLAPQLIAQDSSVQERFLDEAVNSAKLSHSNVVNIFDAEKRGKYTYIVMEYINGKTLDELVKQNGSIAPEAVIRIGIDLCRVLDSAFKIGLIHQDIKPGNIMLNNKFEVKLADFGLAKIINEPDQYQTISGKIYGTPYYMSPESFTAPEKIDLRSDMYSLGATLYHLVTGKLPFETNSIFKIIKMHMSENPVNPSQIMKNVTPRLSSIIMKLLEKSPEKRYSNYSELYRDLKRVEEEYLKIKNLEKVA